MACAIGGQPSGDGSKRPDGAGRVDEGRGVRLDRDIGRYARRLAGSAKHTVLNTNGSLLRKRLDQGLDLAFDAVGLSIDGSTAAVHRGGPPRDARREGRS
jgi:hypothetical protein